MSTTPKVAAEIAARLLSDPFTPFEVETKDGRRLAVTVRWQAMAAQSGLYFGEPADGRPGLVADVARVPWNLVEGIEDLTGAKVTHANEAAIESTDESLTLFTDGACQGNPGPGGWGFIIKDRQGRELGRGSGGERPTTNNRMELTSVIRGLEMLAPTQLVRLVTDSQYVAKGLSEWLAGWKKRGWKRKTAKGLEPVANEDLWRQLDELAATRKVVCHWVRGHAGHPENEECDRMAVEAAANV